MAVSLKTDLRFPESGQHGHGSRIIQLCERIEKEEDFEVLKQWTQLAFQSKSLEEFEEKISL